MREIWYVIYHQFIQCSDHRLCVECKGRGCSECKGSGITCPRVTRVAR